MTRSSAESGKTALVKELAKRIANFDHRVPASLLGKEILSFSTNDLVSNCSYRGQLEKRIESFLEYIEKKNAILFIDEAHGMLRAVSDTHNKTPVTLADALKPQLHKGLSCIGATTNEEYKGFQNDQAMKRRFHKIELTPLTVPQTKDMLVETKKRRFEDKYSITIEDQVIIKCIAKVALDRSRHFPDKAIDLIELLFAHAQGSYIRNIDVDYFKTLAPTL